ncbi:hypothetical protein GXB85_05340 [Cellulomonas sp. APG4]|uniref:hypothetical protein n=1 Tax=Cellulomonas sp. APG4 TaxID=1538656 RepID=UPI00137A5F2E|nr:hypothetical protein [Cellulomonas sp. APG4]NCT90375.1 hypothetical protein [Cellulomonas sp. APG4]
MTTKQAKVLRIVLAIAGLLLLAGGCSAANAATEIEYVCVGGAFECAVDRSPGWVTPMKFIAGFGGPLLLLAALFTRSPEEERKERENTEAYVQRGRDVINAVRERDGGKCQECGASDGTDVVYRSSPVPDIRNPQRYNPRLMVLLCKTHRDHTTPLARNVLGVPVGG